MDIGHHNSCRCNDCTGRRNARRRRFVEELSGRSDPQPSSATLYEVPGNHPAIYADDVPILDAERSQIHVAVHNDANDGEREASQQAGDAGTDVKDPPQQTPQRPNLDPVHSEASAEAVPEIEEVPGSENAASIDEASKQLVDPPVPSLAGAEPEIGLRPQNGSEHPALRPEQLDIQQANVAQLSAEAPRQEQTGAPPPEPGDIHTAAEDPGQGDATLMPDMAGSRRNLRRFALPLIIALILVVVVGAGLLAAAFLSSSRATPTLEVEEPTPNVGATISAAVAMAVADQLNPVSENPSDDGGATTLASIEPGSTSLPQSQPWPPTPSGYVDWEQTPAVNEVGHLVFEAKIDDRANFKPVGRNCGFGNVSLTDNAGSSHGLVLPRSMVVPCGAGPDDWVSNQYYFVDSLLTVTVQLSVEVAAHPGLMVCLWTGGITGEENRLLDCAPVRLP